MSMQNQYSGDGLDLDSSGDSQTTELDTVSTSGADSPTSEQIKGTVQNTVQQVQDTAGKVVSQAQDTAGTVIEGVRQTATSRLQDQKSRAAEGIASAAQVVHDVSRNMSDSGPIAEYADRAAWQLQQFSEYLRRQDLRDIVVDVEHFARVQPTLFLGGGFLLGLLGARFLKSSASGAQTAQQSPGTRTYTASYNAPNYSTRREISTFTTQDNYTVEGDAGYAGVAGSESGDGSTIRSVYAVDALDTGGGEE